MNCEVLWNSIQSFNILNGLLKSEIFVGRYQRKTAMDETFNMLKVRKISIDHKFGKEIFLHYYPPREILERFLSDNTVKVQVLRSGPKPEKFDRKGAWYGDFFQSHRYREIVSRLPEKFCGKVPILLGFYSGILTTNPFWLNCWIIQLYRNSDYKTCFFYFKDN